MGKVILLARVSSQQQDLTQQTDRVLEEIKKDGYTDENIIIIEDKESAVLLSEYAKSGALLFFNKYLKEENVFKK